MYRCALLIAALALARGGHAQDPFRLDVSSDGSDGIFAPTASLTIDLAQARSGAAVNWLTPSSDPDADGTGGAGVYDPEKWAVVYKYESVHIDRNSTVSFSNHSTRAPVVWLVRGDVVIDGWIDVRGKSINPVDRFASEPGPGGFRGGFGFDVGSVIRSGGFGPGGGDQINVVSEDQNEGGAAGHAETGREPGGGLAYGNPSALPLLGGSGAGGGNRFSGSAIRKGGAGGGAILIAAGGTISVGPGGRILADAGADGNTTAGGSGGTVRLVASFVEGDGFITALGGRNASPGYVHVDAFESTLRQTTPPYSFSDTGDPPILFPPAVAPSIVVTRIRNAEIGNLAVPADPHASFAGFPNADVSFNTDAPVTLEIAASNVPLDWTMRVRVVPKTGPNETLVATRISGNGAASIWEATFTPISGISSVQAHAFQP